jgi:hypothetical protein
MNIITPDDAIKNGKGGHVAITLLFENIFTNFKQYIDDVCSIIVSEQQIFGVVRDEVKTVVNSVQCRLAIFIALMFFQHTTTVFQLKKLEVLFNIPIQVRGREFSDVSTEGPFEERSYFINKACINLSAVAPAIPDNTKVTVLGLFSVDPKGSGMSQFYDITELGGYYYINRTILQDSYLDLKKSLSTFLELCKSSFVLAGDNEYSDILLL